MTTSQKMIEAFFWGSIFCTVVSFAVAVLYLADVASRKSATELRNHVRAPAAAWRRYRYDNYHPHYAHAAFIATLFACRRRRILRHSAITPPRSASTPSRIPARSRPPNSRPTR